MGEVMMPDPLEKTREAWAVGSMVSALGPLRRLAVQSRLAWGDTVDARLADTLRFALAQTLTSYAKEGSDEMAAARAALAELNPEPSGDDSE